MRISVIFIARISDLIPKQTMKITNSAPETPINTGPLHLSLMVLTVISKHKSIFTESHSYHCSIQVYKNVIYELWGNWVKEKNRVIMWIIAS